MGKLLRFALTRGAVCLIFPMLFGQPVEFESGGLKHMTLTRSGVTIMFAELPVQVREYAVVQVAVTNGSPSTRSVKPEDFRFQRADGSVVPALPARKIVDELLEKGGRTDVIRLVGTYEMGLYGLGRFQSTNGYEVRRQQAMAEVSSTRIKAAAAASAIAFVLTKLPPGASTDGAIFFPTQGKPLGAGRLIATPGTDRYEFEVGGYRHPGELKIR